jgi:hypothetical protein
MFDLDRFSELCILQCRKAKAGQEPKQPGSRDFVTTTGMSALFCLCMRTCGMSCVVSIRVGMWHGSDCCAGVSVPPMWLTSQPLHAIPPHARVRIPTAEDTAFQGLQRVRPHSQEKQTKPSSIFVTVGQIHARRPCEHISSMHEPCM